MLRRLVRSAALMLVLGARPIPASPQPASFTFAAFGDMPYCSPGASKACSAEVERVTALVRKINRARPAFSLFLGDTKGGSEPCTGAIVFDRTLAWMRQVEGRLVYTPGDNEWTDCWRQGAGSPSPSDLRRGIRERFFGAPRSLGRDPMPLTRQADVSPAHALFVENARWRWNGVLFVTVHVPGSDNNRPPDDGPQPPGAAEEWPPRNAANLAWLKAAFELAAQEGDHAVVIGLQADLWYRQRCGRGWEAGYTDTLRVLSEGARGLGRPVLVLHGDSHFYLHDRPVAAAPNLERVMVPGARDVRAVLVRVDPAAAEPFRFEVIGPSDRARLPAC